jgi:hypothetical protein
MLCNFKRFQVMELAEELRKPVKMVIGVLTGNGKREFKVLRAIAKKYNGSEKVLYFPRRPGYYLGSGLSVLQVVKIYVGKYGIKNFLCLVDKEHFTRTEVEKEIEDKLREFGVEVNHAEQFSVNSESALCVNGHVGAHNFVLWTAIVGKEKCIEENIAKLIEMEFGVKVKPAKNGIAKTLKEHNIDIEKLVASASLKNLKLSFPSLDLVLRSLESNN